METKDLRAIRHQLMGKGIRIAGDDYAITGIDHSPDPARLQFELRKHYQRTTRSCRGSMVWIQAARKRYLEAHPLKPMAKAARRLATEQDRIIRVAGRNWAVVGSSSSALMGKPGRTYRLARFSHRQGEVTMLPHQIRSMTLSNQEFGEGMTAYREWCRTLNVRRSECAAVPATPAAGEDLAWPPIGTMQFPFPSRQAERELNARVRDCLREQWQSPEPRATTTGHHIPMPQAGTKPGPMGTLTPPGAIRIAIKIEEGVDYHLTYRNKPAAIRWQQIVNNFMVG